MASYLNYRYEFLDAETGENVREPRIIKQNENGVDLEDRVHALKIAYRKYSKN